MAIGRYVKGLINWGLNAVSTSSSKAGSSKAGFPLTRMRRNRSDDWTRRMVRETHLSTADLIWPLFVVDGQGERQPVASMPGVERLSMDLIVEAARQAVDLGIPAIAVFPYTDAALKTPDASEAVNADNLVCRTVRAVKAAVGDQ